MDKSAITLERMRSFVRVAERGSFSAVAREQGVGQATITRHITELEGALGVTLLSRTTRRVTRTESLRRFSAKWEFPKSLPETEAPIRVSTFESRSLRDRA